MSLTQVEKGLTFARLHERSGAFVLPNPWDGGSARLLQSLGFEALATSSGAMAGILGRRDGRLSRAEALEQARTIVEATDLPVSADLEKGYGDTPDEVAITITAAATCGLVGGSIEDATGNPENPIFDQETAKDRVAAAVAAARAQSFKFMVTARSENYLRGNPDLADTIERLRAYEAAGADVLMAPGLPDLDAVRQVCSSLQRPFNFMAGIKAKSFTVQELSAAGVKRISLATSLYRAALTAVRDAAVEVKDAGTFGYIDRALATSDINTVLRG
jgi:2-methylisocitrate lyase-like PEP mutase family enzyme